MDNYTKEQRKEYNAEYRSKHLEELKERERNKRFLKKKLDQARRVNEYNRARRAVIADWIRSVKQGLSCSVCGETHPACLEFHHRNPKTKKFNIGDAAAANIKESDILKEMAKCDVVCANCHRKEHYTY